MASIARLLLCNLACIVFVSLSKNALQDGTSNRCLPTQKSYPRNVTPHNSPKDVIAGICEGLHTLSMDRKIHVFYPPSLMKPKALLFLSMLLLSNSADIELNPGPRAPKYPCQICDRAVTWKQRAVACDDCLQWYHVNCMHMSTPTYNDLGNSNVSWHCLKCGLPKFSSSLFDNSTEVVTRNSFDALSSSSSSASSLFSDCPTTPGSPIATSSPAKKTAGIIKGIINGMKRQCFLH